MLQQLASVGKKFAEEFVQSKQDIYVMVTEVNGEQVTVTAKFSPPRKQENTNQVLMQKSYTM